MSEQNESEGLLLPGLDGANPLGFLATLGLLRVLTEADNPSFGEVRVSWETVESTWAPKIFAETDDGVGEDALLDKLESLLCRNFGSHPIVRAMQLDATEPEQRSEGYKSLVAADHWANRTMVDCIACLGSDAIDPSETNQLQTVRRDYFEGNIRSLVENTTRDHLRRSLFCRWDFADPLDNHSLHLNPAEDRRHAHQWNKPSGDPERKRGGGMFGANRLALEAWPLFTSVPSGEELRTLGFTGTRSYNTHWTWPIWDAEINLACTLSLLADPALQVVPIDREASTVLAARGIKAVYRSQRILVGKTPNFTPAERVA